jgi:hypothetical protein
MKFIHRDSNVAGVRTTALRTVTCFAPSVSNTNSLIPKDFSIFSHFSESSFRIARWEPNYRTIPAWRGWWSRLTNTISWKQLNSTLSDTNRQMQRWPWSAHAEYRRIDPLKTKRRPLYLKTQYIPRSKHFISIIKTNQLMLYVAKVAVCSEISTKRTHTVWQNIKFLNVKPDGASRNQ